MLPAKHRRVNPPTCSSSINREERPLAQDGGKSRIVKRCISNLLNSNLTTPCRDDSQLKGYFMLENLPFKRVFIEGVITEIKRGNFGHCHQHDDDDDKCDGDHEHNANIIVIVDDGTATMNCVLPKHMQCTTMWEPMRYQLLANDPSMQSNDFLRRNIDKRLAAFRNNEESFKRGDRVEVLGDFTDFRGRRNCFVSSIKIC